MFKHILLAADGSAASEQAVRTAVQLARELSSVLTAVYVIDPYPYLGFGDTNPMGLNAYLAAARDHAASVHAHVIELSDAAPRVDVRPCLIEDVRAAEGILATARERGADLIVAGSHGRSGVSRALLGSVAARVVQLAPVPVLVVKSQEG